MKKTLFSLLCVILCLGLLGGCDIIAPTPPPPAPPEPARFSFEAPISLDFAEIHVERAAWVHAILPPLTTGLYHYIPGTEGETHLVVYATIRNLTDEPLQLWDLAAEFRIDGRTYPGEKAGVSGNRINAFGGASVAAGSQWDFVIFASLPDEVMASFSQATLTLGFSDGFLPILDAPAIDELWHRHYIQLSPGDIAELEVLPEPVFISFAETVSLDFVEFTIERYEWTDAIRPPDTAGSYRYFSAGAGERLLVLYGRLRNLSDENIRVDHLLSEFLFSDGFLYHGQTNGVSDNRRGFAGSAVEPMEEREIVIFALVSEKRYDAFAGGVVTLGFDDHFTNRRLINIMDQLGHRFSIALQ